LNTVTGYVDDLLANPSPDRDDEFRNPETPLDPYQKLMRNAVYAQISGHPDSFDMGSYEDDSFCGTTRCIAGWAVHLAGAPACSYLSVDQIHAIAIRVLGLTSSEYGSDTFTEVPDALFYTGNQDALERMRQFAEEARA
jgi:hypothetical protein